MTQAEQMSKRRSKWFRIREDLDGGRAGVLALLSFLLPLGIWCFFSYVPWIWHPDIILEISADRAEVTTFYTAGDHVSKEFFPSFANAVREANAELGKPSGETLNPRAVRRGNQKKLRHLAPLAIENGWLEASQREDDKAIYQIWGDIAEGRKTAVDPPLTEENIEIIRRNWAVLNEASPDFDVRMLPEKPLLSLVPQGRRANPVYLPAPHEVIVTGIRDWFAPPANDGPTMGERMLHSVRIVFGGFLLSCLVGIPIGILCGVYSSFSKLIEPFTDFFRYMPAPAFGTLLVAVLLAHDAPKVALVFLGTVFQMILVIAKTTRQLDHSLLEAAQTLGARPRQLLGRVVIPGILPDLYNDLRILLGWSWTWLVIAELIGVKSGLTEFIETQGRFRNFDSVFPVIITIGLLGFFSDQFLAFLRPIFFPWAGKPASGPAKWVLIGLTKVGEFFGSAINDRIEGMAKPRRNAPISPVGDPS
jgi:NitT/TauT family transport system permease protein